MIRRGLHIAVMAVAALATQAPAGSGLIRLTDRDDLFGWEAVGRIELGQDGYCTGVLISPKLVLTAAHCVYDREQEAISASDITFRAGLRDGTSIADRKVARIAAHKGYDPQRPYGAENIRHDAALLELAQPIPTALADPFVLHQGAGDGQRVSVVSYGQGRDDALSWQRDCGQLWSGRNLIAFDCNITFGSSGAPVFVREGSRARILSLVSGGNMNDGTPVAYGMTLAPLVADLKRDLRAMPAVPVAGSGIRRAKVGQGGGASGAKFAKP
ncbi:trypsin-like serine protease [Roseovarius sp. CAU 1744]|uniref:trypsin-like serine peptidase n=1 Tax=Roseovarius sp. CAU 1744 TaxID=3140368 RepID=UPI00325C0253